MKTCKCGKANQPTRKYCIRCGALLIETENGVKEDSTVGSVTELSAELEESIRRTSDTPSRTTGDKWVRPSKVNTERMRTAERHIEKTEFEKAQEAFSRDKSAEGDERMLRASEMHELMKELPTELSPESSISAQPPVISKEPVPEVIEPKPVSKPLPSESSSPIEKPLPKTISPPEMTPAEESRKEKLTHTSQEPVQKSTPEPERSITSKPESAPMAAPVDTSAKRIERAPATPKTVDVKVTSPQEDKVVTELSSNIERFQQQMQQLEDELETMKGNHDEERRRLSTVTEAKRIQIQVIQGDLIQAKNELEDAKKKLQSATNRMKSEIKDAEKKISAQKKRIDNAEKALKKRQSELEKER